MVNGQRTFSVAYCVGMKKVRGRVKKVIGRVRGMG